MIKVISPGFGSSIQDKGRVGYMELGVPISGPMDGYSAKLANQILGNNEQDAVLEITLGKCKLEFNSQIIICVTGADLIPTVNGQKIELHKAIEIHIGDILQFDKPNYGVRCYLGVQGGFQTDVVLKSRSFFKGITNQFIVKKNDILPVKNSSYKVEKHKASVKINKEFFSSQIIEAYEGPEFFLLNTKQKNELNTLLFSISKENSRMGYRLKEKIGNKIDTILTTSVLPGTVQLTPSGALIILMRDCQVTGGYPRVLQLTDMAMNKLAQKSTGDRFKFKIVPLM